MKLNKWEKRQLIHALRYAILYEESFIDAQTDPVGEKKIIDRSKRFIKNWKKLILKLRKEIES